MTAKTREILRVRFSLAWHVFRGRPLAYRVHALGGIYVNEPNAWIYRCHMNYKTASLQGMRADYSLVNEESAIQIHLVGSPLRAKKRDSHDPSR